MDIGSSKSPFKLFNIEPTADLYLRDDGQSYDNIRYDYAALQSYLLWLSDSQPTAC